jgi:methylated-DNA-[protein]-cysteine S-methyltransferase
MTIFSKAYFESPLGYIEVSASEKEIISLNFIESTEAIPEKENDIIKQCIKELDAYFKGTLNIFTIPISMKGTAFQNNVWNELLNIPYGETISYAELSRRIKNPLAIRAVGTANGCNPLSIVVPCHRVIGSNGKLIGYSGGLWRKKWLLDHEKLVKYGITTLF